MTIVLNIRNKRIYDSYYKVFENVIEVKENNEVIKFKVKGEKGFWEVNKNEVERIVM